jgi:HIRAN domain.
MFEPVITKLAGVTFNNSQANIRKWGCADIGTYAVDREPDNPHDPNAVKVSLFGLFPMGYLPKHVAEKLAPLMDDGRTFLAEFICRNEYGTYQNIGLTVRIVETTEQ